MVGAVIATTLLAAYGLAYANFSALQHVMWSGTRSYMIFYAGATVALVMLALTLHAYRSARANLVLVAGAVTLLIGSFLLLQGRSPVRYQSDMTGVSFDHSIVIFTGGQADIDDVPAHGLGDEIIVTRRGEIMQMTVMTDHADVDESATAAHQAEDHPVPGSGPDS